MKKILNILVLGTLLVCLVPAQAQDFTQPRDPAIKSQQIMTTGAAYNGTVYEPFINTTPSEQSYSPAKAPGGPKRTESQSGRNPSDVGDKSEQFPIGDAVLPLLAFALMFCGYVAIRRRRAVNG